MNGHRRCKQTHKFAAQDGARFDARARLAMPSPQSSPSKEGRTSPPPTKNAPPPPRRGSAKVPQKRLTAGEWGDLLSHALGGSDEDEGLDEVEKRVVRLQRITRTYLQKRRMQRTLVKRDVQKLKAGRNLTDEHVVEERQLNLMADLSKMTLESAASALNAYAPTKKHALLSSSKGGSARPAIQ